MGYRALLKNYIRHLLRVSGSHHVDASVPDGPLSAKDVAELRLLLAEVEREDLRRNQRGMPYPGPETPRPPGA